MALQPSEQIALSNEGKFWADRLHAATTATIVNGSSGPFKWTFYGNKFNETDGTFPIFIYYPDTTGYYTYYSNYSKTPVVFMKDPSNIITQNNPPLLLNSTPIYVSIIENNMDFWCNLDATFIYKQNSKAKAGPVSYTMDGETDPTTVKVTLTFQGTTYNYTGVKTPSGWTLQGSDIIPGPTKLKCPTALGSSNIPPPPASFKMIVSDTTFWSQLAHNYICGGTNSGTYQGINYFIDGNTQLTTQSAYYAIQVTLSTSDSMAYIYYAQPYGDASQLYLKSVIGPEYDIKPGFTFTTKISLH